MSKRNAIKYVQNEEPAFLRRFKQNMGYKEGPDVETKKQKLNYEEDDRSDTEEEKPVVVVLKSGDLTAEEVSDAELERKKQEEEQAIRCGKITFKKPVKKAEDVPGEEAQGQSETDKAPKSTADKGKKKDKQKKGKETKKSSLLSFDEDEEEEDG